jgi:hypothetical protein
VHAHPALFGLVFDAANEAANPGDAVLKTIVGFLIALLILTIIFQSFVAFVFALLAAFLLMGLALIWIARRWNWGYLILAGLVVLAGLFIPATAYAKMFPPSGAEPYQTNLALTLFLIASVGIVTAGLLLSSGWKLYKEGQPAESGMTGVSKTNRLPAIQTALILLLGIIILLKAMVNTYWAMAWDNTTDSLGYFWLFFPIVAAIFAGGFISTLLTGRMKAAGLGYAVLVLVLLIAVSTSAQRADYHILTKERAERAAQAIEGYHARFGRYPQNLGQLRGWFAPPLPGPVIIFGEDWCYDGGENYYRLGYIDRQHWSDPRLIGRIHKAAGEMPGLPPICAQQAAALEARDPKYPYTYWKEASD